MAKGWLVVFPGQELMDLFNAKIADQQVVIIPNNEFYPDGLRYKR